MSVNQQYKSPGTEWNAAIIFVICYTCAFPAITSQKVCSIYKAFPFVSIWPLTKLAPTTELVSGKGQVGREEEGQEIGRRSKFKRDN